MRLRGRLPTNTATAKHRGITWQYAVIRENSSHPDVDGIYVTYAIEVQGQGQTETVHDISICKETVEQLAHLFNEHQLSPCHLSDAIADLLI